LYVFPIFLTLLPQFSLTDTHFISIRERNFSLSEAARILYGIGEHSHISACRQCSQWEKKQQKYQIDI
jgi:hypothetical protein